MIPSDVDARLGHVTALANGTSAKEDSRGLRRACALGIPLGMLP